METNRQYIGARYVPKFANPIEWNNLRSYESMEIVTYLGTSYTSKKPVPVGTALDDTEYWAVTGNYNAQVEQYRQDVARLANITEIEQSARKYLLIFDSYGALGVSTIAQQACTSSHVLNVGGAGFVGAGGGETWGDALTTYANSITSDERATFTDIMVFGGINDYSFSSSSVCNAIDSFKASCDTLFPNAKLTIAPISWATRLDGTYNAFVNITLEAYAISCIKNDIKYVVGLNAYIHNDKYMGSDGIHPTSEGATRLGRAIKNFIKTDTVPTLYSNAESATFAIKTGWNGAVNISTSIRGNTVNITGSIVMNTSTPETIPSGATNAFFLGDITNSNFYGILTGGYPSNCTTVPVFVSDTASGTWKLIPASIQIYYGRIYLCIEGGDITTNGLQTTTFSITSELQSA